MDLSSIEVSWEYGTTLTEECQEIIRNVRAIVTTPIGTCPLYREFGLDRSFLDRPIGAARNLAVAEIISKIERFEPRVRVADVKTSADTLDGKLKIEVVIKRE